MNAPARHALHRLGIGVSLLLGGGLSAQAPPPSAAQSCQGCHVMKPQGATWRAGNHARAATCDDCHLPQGRGVPRAVSKAAEGLRHMAITALDAAPPVIRLQAAGAGIVEANCLRCHPRSAHRIPGRPQPTPATAAHSDRSRACLECHRETAHARTFTGTSISD